MKKLILAALLAATTASADAAVTYTFAGTEFDTGASISGTLTIDVDALLGANMATDPALSYAYVTGDPGNNVANPYLSVSFTSAGSNPALLSTGDWTQHLLQADPSDGSFTLELDWQVYGDNGVTASSFYLIAEGLVPTHSVGGATLPDFVNGGTFDFVAMSGTGPNETYDTISAGSLSFAAAAPAPEAATWTMMVLGFGAVGYAARRRARVAFAA